MLKMLISDLSIRRFLGVALILGMGLQAVGLITDNPIWLISSMWAPALGVFVLKKDYRREILSNLRLIELRWISIGILLGAAPYLLSQIIYHFTGLGHWDYERFNFLEGHWILRIQKANLLLGNGNQNVVFWGLNLTLSILISAILIGILLALGEEIGWRGFLQGKLTQKIGVMKGLFLLGLIWGYWHIPANLAGANGADHRLLNTFVIFPLGVVFVTFVIGWLRIRSEAIWPCAFLHGMNNATQGALPFVPNSEFIGKLTEAGCFVLLGAIFIFILSRRRGENLQPSNRPELSD